MEEVHLGVGQGPGLEGYVWLGWLGKFSGEGGESYNKIPQATWFINNTNFFLTVLESGKSKIKVLADSVSGESQLPGSQTTVSSLCPHVVEGVRELSGVFWTVACRLWGRKWYGFSLLCRST